MNLSTSNKGVYHNKIFKQEAEKRGLIIEKADTIGWSVTTPSTNFIEFINTLKIDEDVFSYFRDTRFGLTDPTVKKRYICPMCGVGTGRRARTLYVVIVINVWTM